MTKFGVFWGEKLQLGSREFFGTACTKRKFEKVLKQTRFTPEDYVCVNNQYQIVSDESLLSLLDIVRTEGSATRAATGWESRTNFERNPRTESFDPPT